MPHCCRKDVCNKKQHIDEMAFDIGHAKCSKLLTSALTKLLRSEICFKSLTRLTRPQLSESA